MNLVRAVANEKDRPAGLMTRKHHTVAIMMSGFIISRLVTCILPSSPPPSLSPPHPPPPHHFLHPSTCLLSGTPFWVARQAQPTRSTYLPGPTYGLRYSRNEARKWKSTNHKCTVRSFHSSPPGPLPPAPCKSARLVPPPEKGRGKNSPTRGCVRTVSGMPECR